MPVSIILDTDIDTDCDDVGALAVLHSLADNTEAKILGVVCDAPTPWGAPCVQAINHYYGRSDIPVGAIPSDDYEINPRYQLYRDHKKLMAQHRVYDPYNQTLALQAAALQTASQNETISKVEDGVDLYRRLLAEQPDKSVVIAAIGFLTVLEGLLNSAPDQHSPCNGSDLVKAKVKLLVTMGGGSFPRGFDKFNWRMDQAASGTVLNNWPTPLAVSEWGEKILTGASLSGSTPERNPVRQAYEIYLLGPGRSRSSWDQVALLYSVRGAGEYFEEVREHRMHFSPETGEHRWCPAAGDTGHVYLRQVASDESLAEVIESYMIQPPSNHRSS